MSKNMKQFPTKVIIELDSDNNGHWLTEVPFDRLLNNVIGTFMMSMRVPDNEKELEEFKDAIFVLQTIRDNSSCEFEDLLQNDRS